jgi:hypothetical protein
MANDFAIPFVVLTELEERGVGSNLGYSQSSVDEL